MTLSDAVRGVLRASLFVGAALFAWGLWLGEVVWVKGWASLSWLDGFNWSALPICAVIAVTSSYAVSPPHGLRARMKFVLVGFVLMAGAFAIGRCAVMEFFSAWLVPYYLPLIWLAAAGLAVSAGIAAAAGRWLAPIHAWTVAAVAGALLAVP